MTPTSSWILRPYSRPTAEIRLFCLPPAGHGAAMYRQWGAALPGDIEVAAITLPGRETLLRESPVGDLHELIDHIVQRLPPYLDRPFALFGHSMGSWLAFEITKRLRRDEKQLPMHLFLSGRRAPYLPHREAPMHMLDDAQLIQQIQRRYGGIPATILNEPDILALLLPALRADLRALETYRYAEEAPLPCPISCYGGADDRQVPPEDLEAWRSSTIDSFDLRLFPGGHFYFRDAGQDELMSAIVAALRDRKRSPESPAKSPAG